MNKIFLIITFIILSAFLNDSFGIGNFCKTDIDINKLIQKGKFEKGKLYLLSDTLETEILTFKGKHKINYYRFCISKGKGDSIKVYWAEEINGYKINNDEFVTHRSNGLVFFIHKIKSGKIDLYERRAFPEDNRFLYYIKFSNIKDLFVICPNEEKFEVYEVANPSASGKSNTTTNYYINKGIDQKFKIFIKIYFADCLRVVNMVNSDFYTISDIPSIVESYNNCF